MAIARGLAHRWLVGRSRLREALLSSLGLQASPVYGTGSDDDRRHEF
jgi:hypothetical protein